MIVYRFYYSFCLGNTSSIKNNLIIILHECILLLLGMYDVEYSERSYLIMAKYKNAGKVNVEMLIKSTVENGGGISAKNEGDLTHVTVFSKKKNWHLSYDYNRKDESITNVHSTKDNKPHTDYKGGK